MTSDENQAGTLRRFFAGMSEYIFHSKMGVADIEMVDYLSDLLVRFTKTDAMHRIRQLNGRPATEVFSMMVEAQQRIGQAKRDIHRHIGDFTLFWTGMYPESLRESGTGGVHDRFVSYCHQGKRAYEIASEIESDRQEAPCSLLRRLSHQFEMCAYGLTEIRREWERGGGDDSDQKPYILI